MPLKHAILGLLNYAEMTGYDIDRYFKSSIAFFWHAQTSQIYKELNTCTKHNWVDSEIVYQSDKPNKKVFHIGKYPVPFFRGKPVLFFQKGILPVRNMGNRRIIGQGDAYV